VIGILLLIWNTQVRKCRGGSFYFLISETLSLLKPLLDTKRVSPFSRTYVKGIASPVNI